MRTRKDEKEPLREIWVDSLSVCGESQAGEIGRKGPIFDCASRVIGLGRSGGGACVYHVTSFLQGLRKKKRATDALCVGRRESSAARVTVSPISNGRLRCWAKLKVSL